MSNTQLYATLIAFYYQRIANLKLAEERLKCQILQNPDSYSPRLNRLANIRLAIVIYERFIKLLQTREANNMFFKTKLFENKREQLFAYLQEACKGELTVTTAAVIERRLFELSCYAQLEMNICRHYAGKTDMFLAY